MLRKHSDGGEWASFLEAHFYWVVTGGYLNRTGTVKNSHNWLLKGSQPGSPKEGCIHYKESGSSQVISSIISPSFPPCWLCVWVMVLLPFLFISPSLWWCLSNHLDAVLLELRSEQSILILQLFNLKNKEQGEKKKISLSTSLFLWQLYTALSLQTKLLRSKTECWLGVHMGLCNPWD